MNTAILLNLELGLKRKLENLPKRVRPFTSEMDELPDAVILTGPRGVGKTTFLLYHAVQYNRKKNKQQKLFYFSADNPVLSEESLYEVVRFVQLAGYSGVIIDEVHFAKDWSLHLKALHDDFPGFKIWASDSSSLVLRGGVADLSRRFVYKEMPLMSFREYLYLETGKKYPVYNPLEAKNNTEKKLPVRPSPEILAAFRQYRSVGTRPFYAEGFFPERMLAVLDKTLYADLPFFLPQITDGNLRLAKAIVGTLAKAKIPRLSVRSLCADWGIGAEKLYQLIHVMESLGVLKVIRPENDTKAKSAGAKLFFGDPVLYPLLNADTGTEREALIAFFLSSMGYEIWASRKEEEYDFAISQGKGMSSAKKITLEIGGKSKSGKAADFVVRDDLDYPVQNAIPFWLLGMGF